MRNWSKEYNGTRNDVNPLLNTSLRELIALFALGQTDCIVAKIVDGVPSSKECITQDSKGTSRLREVHPHEATDAGALDLQNVVVGSNSEVVAREGEGEVGKRATLLAINGVLTVP